MNFFKKLTGMGSSKSSDCCGVEIKEVENTQEESCCGTSEASTSKGDVESMSTPSACCSVQPVFK
ncbi:hypothetical protein V7182_03165 [Neobacillus drentensis]|uniref:hypothetical protein n=1 Tax=Neobacillus drentensis TaxID=220684 RepID=UPI002FFEAE7F